MEQNSNVGNKYTNITTNGLTSLPGKFILIAVVINKKGGSSNTVKIYDDVLNEETPEKLLATIDSTANVQRLDYELPMFSGINVRTATGTAPDLTVIYRNMPSSNFVA